MSVRALAICGLAVAASLVFHDTASAIGFVLSESKDELKLKYTVEVADHQSGRVTVVFTLEDDGRLNPIEEAELVIPAQETNADGGHWMDLVVSIELRKSEDGKRIGRVHLLRTLAERAQIRLNTHTLDGQLDPLTRLHHVIPLLGDPKELPATAKAENSRSGSEQSPPATERK